MSSNPEAAGIKSANEAKPGAIIGGFTGLAVAIITAYAASRYGYVLTPELQAALASALGSAGSGIGSVVSSYLKAHKAERQKS